MIRYGVVILNWNGADDTIACLASIMGSNPGAVPIVVDNGSADDSVARISASLENAGYKIASGALNQLAGLSSGAASDDCDAVILLAGENLGFAAGCNLGLHLSRQLGFTHAVFLNNDTIVEVDALTRLVSALESRSDLFATLPMLTIHGTERVWNCGGRISRLGFRRYYHSGHDRRDPAIPAEIGCSFFTGCCFAVRVKEFAARGGFCERFFFGEEDFELCLWMRDTGRKAVCLTTAVVEHKVSGSINRAAGSQSNNKTFVHYLNRFIHMRLRFGKVLWVAWLMLYLPYIAALLGFRRIVRPTELPSFLKELLLRSSRMESVRRADFETILRSAPWRT